MTKLRALGLLVAATMLGSFAACELYEGPSGISPPGGCNAGCLCFGTDQNACLSNGCPWDGAYCVNGFPPDAGSDGGAADGGAAPDAIVTAHDAGSVASCGGTVTCTIAQPGCPTGQVPTIANGCWTGACELIASCDVPPACSEINDQQDCLARSDCGATYSGIDCTTPNGAACTAGDTDCTCVSYVFASCTTKP